MDAGAPRSKEEESVEEEDEINALLEPCFGYKPARLKNKMRKKKKKKKKKMMMKMMS